LAASLLTLDDISRATREVFGGFSGPRKDKNKSYTLVDAALSAFSGFFMQSPLFLEHPRSLDQMHGENKARTLFGVHEIPSDNQIRTLRMPPIPMRSGRCSHTYSMGWSGWVGWIPTGRQGMRCGSPWMGWSILHLKRSIVITVRRASTATVR